MRGTITPEDSREHIDGLLALPTLIDQTLRVSALVDEIARRFYGRRDFLFLGRGLNYPIALEGALKLKEISYIHAEGYPAGEMKYGPIAHRRADAGGDRAARPRSRRCSAISRR